MDAAPQPEGCIESNQHPRLDLSEMEIGDEWGAKLLLLSF